MILLSFALFLLMFVGVGLLSARKHRSTNEDYLLAGQSVAPWLVALSAIASWSSGFWFIGMMGFTYAFGLASIWLILGQFFGDLLMSTFVYKRLRVTSENQESLTYAGTLSRWHGNNFRIVRLIGGLVTVIFLGAYAAAQLNAGSKALHALFGWDYGIGAIIGCAIVIAYCWAGGIRASIWTDAAQAIVMIVSMAILAFVAVGSVGGVGPFIEALNGVSPTFMNVFPEGMALGPFLGPLMFAAGWLFSGMMVIGQPHVMVRYMTMDSPQSIGTVRRYYYGWYAAFCAVTLVCGLAARLLIPEAANFDPELALPTISMQLLPDFLVGLILAGIFAATMSTADSQILACSSSLTRDILPFRNIRYVYQKIATLAVALMALVIALTGPQSVFALVLIAAGALGAIFSPLVMVYAMGGRPSQPLAVAMMVAGFVGMFAWRLAGLGDIAYEVMPGILAGLAVYFVGSRLGNSPARKDAGK